MYLWMNPTHRMRQNWRFILCPFISNQLSNCMAMNKAIYFQGLHNLFFLVNVIVLTVIPSNVKLFLSNSCLYIKLEILCSGSLWSSLKYQWLSLISLNIFIFVKLVVYLVSKWWIQGNVFSFLNPYFLPYYDGVDMYKISAKSMIICAI